MVEIKKEEIEKYLALGFGVYEIADIFEVTNCTVYNKMRKYGITPPKKPVDEKALAKIKYLYYEKELGTGQIAKIMNMTKTQVKYAMKKNECELREKNSATQLFHSKYWKERK